MGPVGYFLEPPIPLFLCIRRVEWAMVLQRLHKMRYRAGLDLATIPIGSMYVIFPYIWLIFMVIVCR